MAGSRTFVHEDVYDEFVELSARKAAEYRVGDPFDDINDQGPQANGMQFDKVMNFIETGKNQGAKVEAGGERANGGVGAPRCRHVYDNIIAWAMRWCRCPSLQT